MLLCKNRPMDGAECSLIHSAMSMSDPCVLAELAVQLGLINDFGPGVSKSVDSHISNIQSMCMSGQKKVDRVLLKAWIQKFTYL